MKIELEDGRGLRMYRGPFRLSRWVGERGGYGREGDGVRWRRLRMYQWPFGVIHALGRWEW